jgi:hypothetical protein
MECRVRFGSTVAVFPLPESDVRAASGPAEHVGREESFATGIPGRPQPSLEGVAVIPLAEFTCRGRQPFERQLSQPANSRNRPKAGADQSKFDAL